MPVTMTTLKHAVLFLPDTAESDLLRIRNFIISDDQVKIVSFFLFFFWCVKYVYYSMFYRVHIHSKHTHQIHLWFLEDILHFYANELCSKWFFGARPRKSKNLAEMQTNTPYLQYINNKCMQIFQPLHMALWYVGYNIFVILTNQKESPF